MASRVSSPVFVGRADELGELVAAMAGARAGTPGLVLVGGEAGVGKSRLVAELTAYASADGATSTAGVGRYWSGTARGGGRREVGMDALGFEQLRPWLAARVELPVGPLFCVVDGPTRGRPWSSANARVEFRRLAAQAGIRRRFAPHQLRHAHAVELAREGEALNVIQRRLGHPNLGTTSICLQGIDTEEIIATVHARRAPMMSATAGLRL